MDNNGLILELTKHFSRVCWFATTSDVKFNQYSVIFAELGWELKKAPAFGNILTEPQMDVEAGELTDLVGHPLRQAARFAAKSQILPYVVEDTMLFIKAVSKCMDGNIGLPGADTKSWWLNLQAQGVLDLFKFHTEREAKFMCQLGAYIGSSEYLFAKGETLGSLSKEPRDSSEAQKDVPRSNPYYFHMIFVPSGESRTLAELGAEEFELYDYRRKCARILVYEMEEAYQRIRRKAEEARTHQMEMF